MDLSFLFKGLLRPGQSAPAATQSDEIEGVPKASDTSVPAEAFATLLQAESDGSNPRSVSADPLAKDTTVPEGGVTGQAPMVADMRTQTIGMELDPPRRTVSPRNSAELPKPIYPDLVPADSAHGQGHRRLAAPMSGTADRSPAPEVPPVHQPESPSDRQTSSGEIERAGGAVAGGGKPRVATPDSAGSMTKPVGPSDLNANAFTTRTEATKSAVERPLETGAGAESRIHVVPAKHESRRRPTVPLPEEHSQVIGGNSGTEKKRSQSVLPELEARVGDVVGKTPGRPIGVQIPTTSGPGPQKTNASGSADARGAVLNTEPAVNATAEDQGKSVSVQDHAVGPDTPKIKVRPSAPVLPKTDSNPIKPDVAVGASVTKIYAQSADPAVGDGPESPPPQRIHTKANVSAPLTSVMPQPADLDPEVLPTRTVMSAPANAIDGEAIPVLAAGPEAVVRSASPTAPLHTPTSSTQLSVPVDELSSLLKGLAQQRSGGDATTTELILEPQELGRIRVTLTGGESSGQIAILAERGETLELVRRHLELVRADLRAGGWETTEFSLSREGFNSFDGESRGKGSQLEETSESKSDTTDVTEVSGPILTAGPTQGGGLDLRV